MSKNKNPKDYFILTGKEYPKYPDDINKEFGYLKILWEIELEYEYPIYYLCECECGNIIVRSRKHLYRKDTGIQNCGCYNLKLIKKQFRKHGDTGNKAARLYSIWKGMKQRCCNPNHMSYKDYGSRGIKICDDWLKDYRSFRKWAKNNGYKKNLTIERKDSNKGYSPDNCTWIPRSEQTKNRRNSSFFIINGEKKLHSDLARELGVAYTTINKMALSGRLEYDYWSKE